MDLSCRAYVVGDLASAKSVARKHAHQWGPEIFIVGGGEIYSESMDIVDRVYLTRISRNILRWTKQNLFWSTNPHAASPYHLIF